MAESEDKEFAAIARAEAERKRNAAIKLVVGLGFVLLLFGGVLAMLGGDPGLKIDVESGEKDLLTETNDPDCRSMIARLEALEAEVKKAELELEAKLLAPEEATVAEARLLLKDLRARFDKERESSKKATLRTFPDREPRRDLDAWFKYVDGELAILDRVAEDHLKVLSPGEPVEVDLKKKKKPKKKKKTLPQRRDAAVLALFDAFENFRVWHTSGFHPCGKAEEGETPWTPLAGAEKGKAKPAS